MTPAVPPVLLRYVEGLRAHDVPGIGRTVSADLRFIGATRTLDKPAFLAFLTALYSGFPDWHYDYDQVEYIDGRYAIHWRQGGTHTALLALPGIDPVPATGRTVIIPEHYFRYDVADGLITCIHPDPVQGGAPRGILEQIGVVLPPL